ncbi:hypothetical protein BC828DRAFT_284155 [Blastocladiella britannica]|nr:hypothetical protein BC828DRAFT_284155 [Blastocladiella britannica]
MENKTTTTALANALVLAYLRDAGMEGAHAAMLDDVDYRSLPLDHTAADQLPPLMALVEHWTDAQLADRAHQSLAITETNPLAPLLVLPPTPPPSRQVHLDPTSTTYPLLHAANVLATCLVRIGPLSILVSAASDRTLAATRVDPNDKEAPATTRFPDATLTLRAPVLAMAPHPTHRHLLAIGCMDGSVGLVSLGIGDNDVNELNLRLVWTDTWHSPKPCTAVAWGRRSDDAAAGRLLGVLVSGGHDGRVVMANWTKGTTEFMEDPVPVPVPVPGFTYSFSGPVEALALTPDFGAVAVAVRDAGDLFVCRLPPSNGTSDGTEGPASVAIPTHTDPGTVPGLVSYHPVHLATSPSGTYLLMATSAASGRIGLWQWIPDLNCRSNVGWTASLVAVYYAGGPRDEWSRPRVAWCGEDDDAYFAVAADNHQVLVVAAFVVPKASETPVRGLAADAVATALPMYMTDRQIVARLQGHTHVVRDLWYDAASGSLVSAAFDQTVRMWPILPPSTSGRTM